jgi:hypothetical protein
MKKNINNFYKDWSSFFKSITFEKNNHNDNMNAMVMFGFNNYEEFSNELDTDLAFRHFVYDFLKEKLVE